MGAEKAIPPEGGNMRPRHDYGMSSSEGNRRLAAMMMDVSLTVQRYVDHLRDEDVGELLNLDVRTRLNDDFFTILLDAVEFRQSPHHKPQPYIEVNPDMLEKARKLRRLNQKDEDENKA